MTAFIEKVYQQNGAVTLTDFALPDTTVTPAEQTVSLSSFQATNLTGAAVTVDVAVVGPNLTTYIAKGLTIAANTTTHLISTGSKVFLPQGYKIQVLCSAAAAVDFTATAKVKTA